MTREEQMKRLQAFLDEWFLDRQLSTPETPELRNLETPELWNSGTSQLRNPETSEPRNIETSELRNYETTEPRNLETSELRNYETSEPRNLKPRTLVLLPPVGEVASSRPVYVVLVEKHACGRWLAVPFSRFSTPATDGELLTSCAAVPLSVIQVWNAGEVDGGILDRGWVMGELPAGDFRLVLAHVRGGRPLPPSRRGAPVVHPLDPRRDYIEEERALWFGLSSATFSDEELDEPLPEAAETDSK